MQQSKFREVLFKYLVEHALSIDLLADVERVFPEAKI